MLFFTCIKLVACACAIACMKWIRLIWYIDIGVDCDGGTKFCLEGGGLTHVSITYLLIKLSLL